MCERSVVEQVSVPEFRAGHAVCLVFDVCVVVWLRGPSIVDRKSVV